MSIYRHWVWVALLLCVAVSGCAPETSTAPTIEWLEPVVVEQDSIVYLHGHDFGPLVPRDSQVFVNGACSELVTWSDEVVAFRVPRGVGVGARLLTLVRGDGVRVHHTLQIGGDDLPSSGEVCASTAVFEPRDVRPDQRDMSPDATPDQRDMFPDQVFDVRPDIPPVDIVVDVPDVPIDAGSGVYTYVRIQDISLNDLGRNPGVDIDALVVTKSSGEQHFAFGVVEYVVTPNSVVLNNPQDVLGAPDAYGDYPDLTWCSIRDGRASLGGEGLLIVQFDVAIEEGDLLEVLEVGNCLFAPDLMSLAEEYEVHVAIDPGDPSSWVSVGDGLGPTSFDIPALPSGGP